MSVQFFFFLLEEAKEMNIYIIYVYILTDMMMESSVQKGIS